MMLIRIAGTMRTGKTHQLLNMGMNTVKSDKRVLYIVPTKDYAKQLEVTSRNRSGKICFVNPSESLRMMRQSRWDAIILDGLEYFTKSPEGAYLNLAGASLSHWPYAYVAFSCDGTLSEKWVSTVTWWKPWTWGTGYWERY